MARNAPHRLVAFVAEGASMFELAIASEVFGAKPDGVDTWYRFDVVTEHPGPIRLDLGLTVDVPSGLGAFRTADTVIIAGWSSNGVASEKLLAALRSAHRRGARIVSFCSGAFLLAEAGLLQGRPATTHWNAASRFRTRFPDVDLDPDVLYIDDGDVLTSAGSASAIDLSLHLVRLDHGAHVANLIARDLVVPPHRQGGQAQFVATSAVESVGDEGLAPTLDWIIEHLDEDLSLASMARHSNLSTRQFSRRFLETTGTTPHQWLITQRVTRAQDLLEQGHLSIEEVARHSGFTSAAAMRPHFIRLVTTTPAEYRRCFAAV